MLVLRFGLASEFQFLSTVLYLNYCVVHVTEFWSLRTLDEEVCWTSEAER